MEVFTMKIARSLLSAVVATSLLAAPSVASAAPADVEQTRAGAPIEGEEIRGRGGVFLPLAFLVAAILAVLLLTDGGDQPVSP
jgi:hypothetical protein